MLEDPRYVDLFRAIEVTYYFPFIFLTIFSLFIALGYKRLVSYWGNVDSLNYKSRRLSGNWAAWMGVLIFLFPTSDVKNHQSIYAMASYMFLLKMEAWIIIGIGSSVLVGFSYWAFHSSKHLFARMKKSFIHSKSLIDVSQADS